MSVFPALFYISARQIPTLLYTSSLIPPPPPRVTGNPKRAIALTPRADNHGAGFASSCPPRPRALQATRTLVGWKAFTTKGPAKRSNISLHRRRLSYVGRAVLGNAGGARSAREGKGKLALLVFPHFYTACPKLRLALFQNGQIDIH